MSTGIELIAAERWRQIEQEGWTPDHDAEHDSCEMGMAASAYLLAAQFASQPKFRQVPQRLWMPDYWPWDVAWWKPSNDPIRNLVKAGALVAAEIDRLRAVTPT